MVDVWAAVASWATPTALFILLNVVIGFIAVFASRKNDDPPPPDLDNQSQYHYQQQQQQQQIHRHEESQQRLVRAPSLFSRLTSFDFSNLNYCVSSSHQHYEAVPYTSSDNDNDVAPPPLARTPPEPESQPLIERSPSLLSRMASINFSFHRSTEPELEPAESAAPVEAREEHVTRSVTEPKRKPPARSKMKKSSSEKAETASFGHNDDGVDAKADDFINRFKQQLRLQRLDSLLRYRSSAGGS